MIQMSNHIEKRWKSEWILTSSKLLSIRVGQGVLPRCQSGVWRALPGTSACSQGLDPHSPRPQRWSARNKKNALQISAKLQLGVNLVFETYLNLHSQELQWRYFDSVHPKELQFVTQNLPDLVDGFLIRRTWKWCQISFSVAAGDSNLKSFINNRIVSRC